MEVSDQTPLDVIADANQDAGQFNDLFSTVSNGFDSNDNVSYIPQPEMSFGGMAGPEWLPDASGAFTGGSLNLDVVPAVDNGESFAAGLWFW